MVDVRAGGDPPRAGWHALDEARWGVARSCFEAALAVAETPEAYEGLGWAGYPLDDDVLPFDARERAYRLYRERGDARAAARVAAWLAADCLEFRGESAVSNGWLQRAHSLTDDLEPGPDHGWLAVHEASIIIEDDPAAVQRLGAYAAELGQRFGVPELEMVGLGLEGRALVSEGDLVEGMRRLDGATAAALAGEAKILACVVWAACYLIAAREKVRDYVRARQWCGRMRAFCEQHGIGMLLGVCRAKYAGVLTWQGDRQAAEAELRAAVERLAARPPMSVEALVRLAEIRRRQGRLHDAEELFARRDGHVDALLARALLALDRGQAEDATEPIDRFLRNYPTTGRLERAAGLEVSVAAHAELGRDEPAREALDELRTIAERAATKPLHAAVLAAEGTLSAAAGDHAHARRSFEDALDLLGLSAAPYETAGFATVEVIPIDHDFWHWRFYRLMP